MSNVSKPWSSKSLAPDWDEWPLERRYKAACKWGFPAWYGTAVWCLIKNGVDFEMVKKAVWEAAYFLGKKYGLEGIKKTGMKGYDASCCATYHHIADQVAFLLPFHIVELSPNRTILRYYGCCFDPKFNVDPTTIPRLHEICDCEGAYEQAEMEEMTKLDGKQRRFYITKRIPAGDGYFEGVWEYDGELEESRSVNPTIDPDVWPLERRYKTATRWGLYWFTTTMWKMLEIIGWNEKVEQAMKDLGEHVCKVAFLEGCKKLGIEGNDAKACASYFLLANTIAFNCPYNVIELTSKRAVLRIPRSPTGGCVVWDAKINVDPTEVPHGPKFCQAYNEFGRTAARLMNPKLKYTLTKTITSGEPYCEQVFELED